MKLTNMTLKRLSNKFVPMILLTSAFAALPSTINDPVPEQYQGEAEATVVFFDTFWEVEVACDDFNPDWRTYACYRPEEDIIVMPNPCGYPEARQTKSYAYLMCHEKAHKKGWKH